MVIFKPVLQLWEVNGDQARDFEEPARPSQALFVDSHCLVAPGAWLPAPNPVALLGTAVSQADAVSFLLKQCADFGEKEAREEKSHLLGPGIQLSIKK